MSADPGLQPQRTTLAWTRTAIACGALAAILTRHAVLSGRVVDMVAAALGGVMTVSVLVLGRLSRERIRACVAEDRTPVVPYEVVTVTWLTSAAAVLVIVSIATAGFR
jgi:uncharacterized membrane protein YidH (DUF202 family)